MEFNFGTKGGRIERESQIFNGIKGTVPSRHTANLSACGGKERPNASPQQQRQKQQQSHKVPPLTELLLSIDGIHTRESQFSSGLQPFKMLSLWPQ